MSKLSIGPVAITGAASGIGAAVAHFLSEQGVATVSFDLRPPDDAALDSFHVNIDITDEAAVAQAAVAAEEHVGSLYGLVNAAGILGKVKPPERPRLSDWEREINVDLTGTYIVTRTVGEGMAVRGSGSIVNIASIAGMTSRRHTPIQRQRRV